MTTMVAATPQIIAHEALTELGLTNPSMYDIDAIGRDLSVPTHGGYARVPLDPHTLGVVVASHYLWDTTPAHAPVDAVMTALTAQRNHAGISIDDVAETMGVTPAHVTDMESGRVDPRLSHIRAYAAAVGNNLTITLMDA